MPNQSVPVATKRALILGAGFSRSLGGPLMADLLSLAARRRVLAAYSDLDRDDVDQVFWIFHYGAGFPEGPLDPAILAHGETAWADAEQFLETLDSARNDRASETIVNAIVGSLREIAKTGGQSVMESARPRLNAFRKAEVPSLERITISTRRLIAASCSVFMEGIDKERARRKERWRPYQDWVGLLRADDSILTFNYDTVVETLKPDVGSSARWGVSVVGIDDGDAASLARLRNIPGLYKLHGSVNWTQENGQIQRQDSFGSILAAGLHAVIATPGDSKMEMASGLLKQLWSGAAARLREAEEITLIGFRFPQSDAFPRDQLLSAMRDNDNRKLRVNVVLGPAESPDVKRVVALLEWTCGVKATANLLGGSSERAIVTHSLWAEDYLTVWAGKQ